MATATLAQPLTRLGLGRLGRYRPPIELAVSCAGAAVLGWYVLIYGRAEGTLGFDSFAYWNVSPAHPYAAPLGVVSSFPYTPAAAMAFAPAHLLRFAYFYLLWAGLMLGCLAWLTRRYTLAWLAFPAVSLELYNGNVHLLLAVVCVLGFRYPALWSIGLLTKVTPGVSLLWFVARSEWRSLALALGATVALAIPSLVLYPGAWADYVGYLRSSLATGPLMNGAYEWLVPPLALRLAVAGGLVWWGARTNRRWTVPCAVVIAMPVLWNTSLAILAALPRLLRPETRARSGAAAAAEGRS